MATLEIPASTNVTAIGIKCVNALHGPYGIMAQVTDETGKLLVVTDSSWKCSKKATDGWSEADFVETDSWQPASVKKHPYYDQRIREWKEFSLDSRVIWNHNGKTVYCRKNLPKLRGNYITVNSLYILIFAFITPRPRHIEPFRMQNS